MTIEQLKAEIARLNAEVDNSNRINTELLLLSNKQASEVRRLKAEVERLRKAGDELLHEWSSGDETDGRNFKKGLVIWNAAKEGKPSV